MPVWWIEQKEGPHKTAIDEAVREYREGTASAGATWGRLAALYRKVKNNNPPDFSEHQDRGEEHMDYMICLWFVRYANSWYSGSARQCEAEVARLNRANCGKFRIMYEY